MYTTMNIVPLWLQLIYGIGKLLDLALLIKDLSHKVLSPFKQNNLGQLSYMTYALLLIK